MFIGAKYVGRQENDIVMIVERSISKPDEYLVKHLLHHEYKWTTYEALKEIGYTLLEIPSREIESEELPNKISRINNID